MHQNKQAVKMRFKPLRNSSHDTDIIIEREKRFRGIVGGNRRIYTPRLYPTTNKKPQKTPCNTVVYIRMYTTIASRQKGIQRSKGKHSETLQKSHCLKLAARHTLPISIFDTRLQETIIGINRKFQKVAETAPNKGIRSKKISPSAAFCKNPDTLKNTKNNINPLLQCTSITCIIKIDKDL